MTPEQETRHFVATGDHDMLYGAWPGRDFLEKARKGENELRGALIEEIRRRTEGCDPPSLPAGFDAGQFVLGKVGPMVRGFFPARERQAMFDLFEKSLLFVTHNNIEQLLSETHWMSTAWQVANLYLGSLGLPGLDEQPVGFVGLSEEATFYVSIAYFEDGDPFADWVVHEAAHVFHNWKRDRAGLPVTRGREFLLEIAFAKREVFAYACEAYTKIVERAKSPADRRRLHAEYARNWVPDCDGLDRTELLDILADAVGARNGWKRILNRCGPLNRTRSSERKVAS
jgi:hypothetical protein